MKKLKRSFPQDAIAAGPRHTVGLKSNGTVMAVGDHKYGQCDVSGWLDIVAIAAGNVHMATNTGNAIQSVLDLTVLLRLWVGISMTNAM